MRIREKAWSPLIRCLWPVTVDLDRDGDLDLNCRAKPMTDEGGDASDPSRNALCFRNVCVLAAP